MLYVCVKEEHVLAVVHRNVSHTLAALTTR